MLVIAGLTTMVLSGCQKQDEVTETPEPAKTYVLADLALSMPASPAHTRMAEEVVQASDNFRGIQKMSIIPFTKQGKVESSDVPVYYEGFNSYEEKTTTAKDQLRYYNKVYLMHGVSSFLVYGQATTSTPPTGVSAKTYNGSLRVKVDGQTSTGFPDRVVVSPSHISFELEPIYDETDSENKLVAPTIAQHVADYLTNIALATGTVRSELDPDSPPETLSWENAVDLVEKMLYTNFTNQGSSDGGVIAGSPNNAAAFVNAIYSKLQSMDYGDGTMEKAIADDIMSRIRTYEIDDEEFVTFDETNQKVTSLGADAIDLPDGAFALLWDEANSKFVPQTTTTTLAPVNTISRFAYPAELYYYANSRIKTSNSEVAATAYENQADWAAVLDNYEYDDAVVSSNSRAVAIKDPLQYGVARLKATVRSTTSSLHDANGELVTVGSASFPITGIIVSGQWPVDFAFKSKDSDVERFVYDGFLNTNTGNTSYCLSTTNVGPFHTLLLQNKDGEDVTVILELQNNSGQDFRGENGLVYKGTKFYLIGTVELSTGTTDNVDTTEKEDVKKRVFTQDHTTEIEMKVASLAHAYNVLPNILAGQLEIGVEIKLNWVQATPTVVILPD